MKEPNSPIKILKFAFHEFKRIPSALFWGIVIPFVALLLCPFLWAVYLLTRLKNKNNDN